jgi:hypothetical protein
MPEEKSHEPKKISRRDFLKVATGATLGAGAERVARKIKDKSSDEKALVSVETSMSNLPFNVTTNLEKKSVKLHSNEQVEEITNNQQVEDFLKGGGIISTLMTEKYLTGKLTIDQIEAVTDAVLRLQGIELSPKHEKRMDESASLDSAIEGLNSSLKRA